MVRDRIRPPHRTEEDRVEGTEGVEPVAGKHLTVLRVVLRAGKVELHDVELEPEGVGGSVQHPHTLRHHLFTDAITGDSRDAIPTSHAFAPVR